jgi:valyl-tRNA synthetase
MSGYVLGDIPFHTVYLHGTVRDAKGRKMSKSLGNGIDPLDIAEKFGADAGRMALVTGTAPGTDSRIDENKIKGYKNFANKIWNITRFVLENYSNDLHGLSQADGLRVSAPLASGDSDPANYLSNFIEIKKDITSDMDNYRFHMASEKIYHYVWHTFADKIIEESKTNEKIKEVLLPIWEDCLKILHPFIPFVTEEIWQTMKKENLLMVEAWPARNAFSIADAGGPLKND